ncbi:MAG: contractile injection system protein, VgrG/Pvc8 family, partial [Bradyrhizobium sp.]
LSRAAAAPLQTDKKPKAFRITTALGVGIGADEKDPLLLAQISGSEAVSQPYAFELTVVQRKKTDGDADRPAIDPRDLLNTDVTFGISSTENDGQFFDWIERHGTIDHFEELADTPSDARGIGFRCYVMRVVPRFRLLERERTFRVFENMDVLSVIRAVFQAQGEIPADYLILQMEDSKFPPMPYCVQFGEDSLTFVSRLMAQFGLWYFFFHDHERDTEQMILGRGRARPRGETATLFRSDAPEQRQVSGYRRIFSPAPKRVNVGEFNPLDPTDPFQGSEKIADRYDIAVKNNVHTPGRFQHRIFPGSFLSNEGMRGEATQRMQSGEAAVFTATGQSKNRRLRAG